MEMSQSDKVSSRVLALSSIVGEWRALESIRKGKLGLEEKTLLAVLFSAAVVIPRSQDIAAAKATEGSPQENL